YAAKSKILLEQQRFVEFSRESADIAEAEQALEADYNSANDHLNLVMNALRHQEKIERYQDEVEELNIKLEEQQEALEEITEIAENAQARADEADDHVEELRSQMADYQQALDAQQTRALQYQQAVNALEKAKQLTGLVNLDLNNI
ncbi:hypothetical protein, partial [Staphylococcus aureus]|uniref:hypothetical protein n=1 Tax=Staphylococcus aureus TaxID=1280 RepID=UPI0024A89359